MPTFVEMSFRTMTPGPVSGWFGCCPHRSSAQPAITAAKCLLPCSWAAVPEAESLFAQLPVRVCGGPWRHGLSPWSRLLCGRCITSICCRIKSPEGNLERERGRWSTPDRECWYQCKWGIKMVQVRITHSPGTGPACRMLSQKKRKKRS